MIVHLFDQGGTQFAEMSMDVLPRKDDTVEIGGHAPQPIKHFTVYRVVHKMVPDYGIPAAGNPPWRWEYQLYGSLYDPATDVPENFNPRGEH